ncbi:DNA cytosine methyltransferase [Chryseobacterium taichungense]|uniref:DNA cytosine methyltransferase n=1 Tax=Chryseobacterium taichungense TaxID=295069 RepID=UPI0028B0892F|nr:DNA cytosine methyltransferase [Chryseobacterium taichungense]
MKVVSFFAGAGGLDLGFEQAGFNVIWANEYDKDIWATYEKNHTLTALDKRSIVDIPSEEVPDCDGIIGGPPCQSWSAAGSKKGIADKRGQLFYEFMRILADKQPKFFLAENVAGMLSAANKDALENIKEMFTEIGYELSFQLLNVSDYGVPQDRKRVFFIGYRKDLKCQFVFPQGTTIENKVTLEKAIGDLKNTALPAKEGNLTNGSKCKILNHEYMIGGFSSIFMSRNRVRSWHEVSFTIQAGGRHAPLHPQAPKMTLVKQDVREFKKGQEKLYRRLSVRECARIQTFPDNFSFEYTSVVAGYKMIGNAVPVQMGKILAEKIYSDLRSLEPKRNVRPSSKVNGDNVREKLQEIVNKVTV